jgi:hypothetical protein
MINAALAEIKPRARPRFLRSSDGLSVYAPRVTLVAAENYSELRKVAIWLRCVTLRLR